MQATTTRHRRERRKGGARRPPVPVFLACIAFVLAAVPAHAASASPLPDQRREASHAAAALAPPRAVAGRWTHRPAVSTGHEQWRKQANGPMVVWKVVKGPCPGSKVGYSCADPGSKTIFLNKYDWNKKSVYYHEHGHAFDSELLTDQDRTAIAQHFGWKGRWFWGDWDPETHAAEPNQERFADMYAKMLTHPRKGIWLRRYLRAVVQRAKPA